MYNVNHTLCFLTVLLGTLFLGGCSADEELPAVPSEGTVPVRFEITSENLAFTRVPGDATLSANRLLMLPFVKTDENQGNSPSNFTPVYSAAKQLNANTFPVVGTMLNLNAASTYQIVIIGYNQNDYDFTNPASPSRRFDIGSATEPITLDNLYLKPVSPVSVPEFFTCIGNAYSASGVLQGAAFKPGQTKYVTGSLTRIVSGLTLNMTGIPGYITSITLVAERLATASKPTDGTPLSWQTAGDAGLKVFETQVPVAGSVSFNKLVLPTMDAQNTLLYLDVTYGMFTDRYTVKVPDQAGVSAANRLTFNPNHQLNITGTYSSINLGFTLSETINLDDDAWDGLQ